MKEVALPEPSVDVNAGLPHPLGYADATIFRLVWNVVSRQRSVRAVNFRSESHRTAVTAGGKTVCGVESVPSPRLAP